jgi:hypothetical protein
MDFYCDQDVEKLEHSCTADGNKSSVTTLENSLEVFQTVKLTVTI